MEGATAWTHLLPSGAVLEARGLPGDLEQALGPRMGPEGDTLVGWDASPTQLGSLERYRTVVLARPRGEAVAALRARGFPHVRLFAALPDLRRARWYVPVASRRISAEAWNLYAPSTLLGRAARLGAVWLTRTVGASGFGEDIVVAGRMCSPLDAAISEAIGGGEFDLAIGLPHQHGQRARLWLLAIDGTGRSVAFAKLAYRAQSVEELERESAFSRHVVGLSLRTAFVPKVLHAGAVADGYLLVTEPLPNSSRSSTTLGSGHLAVLAELATFAGTRTAGELAQQLGARCARLAGELPREWAQRLDRAADVLASSRDLDHLPTSLAHGDFVPWNMRRLAGDPRLAVFDWEQGQTSQFALWDAFNFLAQVDIVLRRIPAEQSVRSALGQVGTSPLARELRLVPRQVWALYLAYLADSSARWFESHVPATWQFEIARTRTQPVKAAMLDAALSRGA